MARYTIYVTKKCNANCTYCYEQDKETTYSWDEINNVLDRIIKNNDKIVEIEFIGGEPLLEFDLINKSVKYLNNYINVLTYYITTNGTILNDDIIKFLKENNNVIFAISLDGNKFMNQLRVFKNGINTYDTVMRNINILKKNIDIERIMIHITVHPWNVGYLSDGVNHLYNHGIKFIDVGIIEKTMSIDDNFKQIYINESMKISKLIKQGFYKDLKYIPFLSLPILDRKQYEKENNKFILEIRGDIEMDSTYSQGMKGYIYDLKKQVYNNHKEMMFDANV